MESMEARKAAMSKVKDKTPAPIQITAEQLLQEATARLGTIGTSEKARKRAKNIADRRDLGEWRERERRSFEDNLRRNRGAIGVWIKYARFEESQHDYTRARSIYERALDVDPRNITLWLKYALMEMQARNLNLARNVLDRAVTIQPRVDQFWFKYVHMEELLGDLAATGDVWERWMMWEPEPKIWWSYVKFAERHKQWSLCTSIIERLLAVHPDDPSDWTKAAHFYTQTLKDIEGARIVFERALDIVGSKSHSIWIEMAKWEVKQMELDRARMIYKLAIDRFPEARGLFHSYAQFERQHGTEADIEAITVYRRKEEYEQLLASNPLDHDRWFDYLSLLEDTDTPIDVVREVYERAIACTPPDQEQKRNWRRYVYLWFGYATFEELRVSDMEHTELVLKAALGLEPLRRFSKVWIWLADFYLRVKQDLVAFRKIMGQALGIHPSRKLFRAYIERESSLREFDRCRRLYERWIELSPSDTIAWTGWIDFEAALDEKERTRSLLTVATSSDQHGIVLDQPEVIWKTWIDLETTWQAWDHIPTIYEHLLEKTGHIKVWLAFANLYYDANGPMNDHLSGRQIMQRAFDYFKPDPDTRLLLLESWRTLEAQKLGNNHEFVKHLLTRFPRRVKKQKPVPEGTEQEEYWELLFPDDEASESATMKLLAAAHQWKKQVTE